LHNIIDRIVVPQREQALPSDSAQIAGHLWYGRSKFGTSSPQARRTAPAFSHTTKCSGHSDRT
jgi:hypothetical protein